MNINLKFTRQELEEVLDACGALDRGLDSINPVVLEEAIGKMVKALHGIPADNVKYLDDDDRHSVMVRPEESI